MASGYIAGGAIAGILIAIMQGVLTRQNTTITHWAESFNPFYAGAQSDWLALIPFVLLAGCSIGSGRSASAKTGDK